LALSTKNSQFEFRVEIALEIFVLKATTTVNDLWQVCTLAKVSFWKPKIKSQCIIGVCVREKLRDRMRLKWIKWVEKG